MSAQLVGQYDPAMTAHDDRDDGALPRGLPHRPTSRRFLVDGTSRAGIEAALVSLLEPGDRVLVPVFGRFGHLLTEIAERCGAEVHTIEVAWGEVFTPEQIEAAVVAVRPEGARRRAGRHLDHDVPAARRPRRDLPAPRRAALLRRHRLARRQRVRDRRLGPRRGHRRAAEVPGRPVGQRPDHALAPRGRGHRRPQARRGGHPRRPASADAAAGSGSRSNYFDLAHDHGLLGPAPAQPPHRGHHDALRRPRVRPAAGRGGPRRRGRAPPPARRRDARRRAGPGAARSSATSPTR